MEETHTCIPWQNRYLNHGARLEIRDVGEHARHANATAIAIMSVRITVKAASERPWGAITSIGRGQEPQERYLLLTEVKGFGWDLPCSVGDKTRRGACHSALHHVATWLLFKHKQLLATLPTVKEMRVMCTESRSKPGCGKAIDNTGLKFFSYSDTCLNYRRMSHALRNQQFMYWWQFNLNATAYHKLES